MLKVPQFEHAGNPCKLPLHQALYLHGGFADPEMLGRFTDGGVVFHDVKGKFPRPLFNILSHSYHSHRLLGAVYARGRNVYDGGIVNKDFNKFLMLNTKNSLKL